MMLERLASWASRRATAGRPVGEIRKKGMGTGTGMGVGTGQGWGRRWSLGWRRGWAVGDGSDGEIYKRVFGFGGRGVFNGGI